MIKLIVKRVAIVIIGILIVLLGRGLFYYSGFYSAPPSEMPSYEYTAVPEEPSTEFSDEYEVGEGVILIDLAHDNAFDKDELNVLTSRLISRGLTVEFLEQEDDIEEKLLGEEVEKEGDEEKKLEEDSDQEKELEEELLVADAFIVVCPQLEFSEEEREAVDKFVDDKGKLLLIADPTRRSKMSSLSLRLGLIFESDYLYNMKEYDINYRNIFITEFEDNRLTNNLEKIALYTAGSITSADGGIAFVDGNTLSSVIETRKKLSPIALTCESKVLAVYDLTFITEPYNGVKDNNQLISNIADWLASPAAEEEEEREELVESNEKG